MYGRCQRRVKSDFALLVCGVVFRLSGLCHVRGRSCLATGTLDLFLTGLLRPTEENRRLGIMGIYRGLNPAAPQQCPGPVPQRASLQLTSSCFSTPAWR